MHKSSQYFLVGKKASGGVAFSEKDNLIVIPKFFGLWVKMGVFLSEKRSFVVL